MASFFCRLGNFILDLLFPLECLQCGGEGYYLCPGCFRKLKLNTLEDLSRAKINLRVPDLTEIYIAGNYEDKILKNLIIKYKYNFLSPLGRILADFLIDFWKTLESPSEDILVIPIPLSQKRLRWRGFNQAEIIAREFSAYFNYGLSLNLRRTKHTRPQAELDELGRQENVRLAFAWAGKNGNLASGVNLASGINLKGKTIILIDDVVTTGATLNEAAKILKAAGAAKIYGLVLAKG